MAEKTTEQSIEEHCRFFLKWRKVYGRFFGDKEHQRMCDALGVILSKLVSKEGFISPIKEERDITSALWKLRNILVPLSHQYKSEHSFQLFGADFPLSESKHISSDGDCWNFEVEWCKTIKQTDVSEHIFRLRFHPLMELEFTPWIDFKATTKEAWRADWDALVSRKDV